MKEVHSKKIHPSMRVLLSHATGNVEQEYKKYIQSVKRKLYTLVVNREIIGCIGVEFIRTYHCEIKHIAVSPSERGNGIGSKMIDFISHEYSLESISAETDIDAVDFYKSYGFKAISLGEKYPGVERFLCEYKVIKSKKSPS